MPEGLAAIDVERDAVDGVHLADDAVQDAAADGEVLDEFAHFDERHQRVSSAAVCGSRCRR
jgi:hypothetical protein